MAVSTIIVGDARIFLSSYNPRDVVTTMLCDAVVGLAKERLAGLTLDECLAWVRKNLPQWTPVIERVEAGDVPTQQVPIGTLPVTPGREQYEIPVVSMLNEWSKKR